jgi:hypothetical protein
MSGANFPRDENSPYDDTLVIEPANEEEIALIEEGMREYESDPSSFRNWKDVKRDLGLG